MKNNNHQTLKQAKLGQFIGRIQWLNWSNLICSYRRLVDNLSPTYLTFSVSEEHVSPYPSRVKTRDDNELGTETKFFTLNPTRLSYACCIPAQTLSGFFYPHPKPTQTLLYLSCPTYTRLALSLKSFLSRGNSVGNTSRPEFF